MVVGHIKLLELSGVLDDLLADEWKEDDNDDTSLNFNDIVNDASEDNNDLGEI